MIKLFLALYLLLIILSYFFNNLPNLFFILLIFIAYRYPKNWGTSFLVIFIGFFSDVFFEHHYPVLMLYNYLTFLILHQSVKHFLILKHGSFLLLVSAVFTIEIIFQNTIQLLLDIGGTPFSISTYMIQLSLTLIFSILLFHLFRKQFILTED